MNRIKALIHMHYSVRTHDNIQDKHEFHMQDLYVS